MLESNHLLSCTVLSPQDYYVRESQVHAYRTRISEIFLDIEILISPRKENFHMNSVCIGCIGRHTTFSLG